MKRIKHHLLVNGRRKNECR